MSEAGSAPVSILREHGEEGAEVGYAELFFDLVYVFAVTQLSHYLLNHDDILGLAQAAVLTGAIWWAWTHMTWATNWLDPERFWVRIMIFTMMFAGLAMGAALPKAFGEGGLIFAAAYVGAQLLRTVFLVRALRAHKPKTAAILTRATIWFALTAPLWIGGAFAGETLRLGLWAAAIAIELAAPLWLYRLPGMTDGKTGDLDVTGEHMAERCGLFVMVALGESILVTGGTVAGMTLKWETSAAFVVAFLGSVAMWWIYFDRGADKGSEHIARAADAEKVARDTYGYLHLPIVGGIIVAAVADEMLLAHPLGHLEPEFVLAAIGGPALFVAGCMLFKRQFWGFHPISHLSGLGLFALLGMAAVWLHPLPLVVAAGSVLVLFVVAVWEWLAVHGGAFTRPRPISEDVAGPS